jgi:leucyl/phenylalanyl-tRNA---protein transferase
MTPVDTDILRQAIKLGLFPMGEENSDEIGWYRPDLRCLIPIDGIHVSRSLARTLRRHSWRISIDEAFESVMRHCRRPRDNWITPPIIDLYLEAHAEGWAHSLEIWEDQELVGGVYGLHWGGLFAAESKFHLRTDASKVALYHLVHHVRALGCEVFDAQFINDHTASLGAYEIPQSKYLQKLPKLLTKEVEWSRELKIPHHSPGFNRT